MVFIAKMKLFSRTIFVLFPNARTSRLFGVCVKVLMMGNCRTFLRFFVVIAQPNRTLKSADTLVSKASS